MGALLEVRNLHVSYGGVKALQMLQSGIGFRDLN